METRIHNTYFDETNSDEIKRLHTQRVLLNKFDRHITDALGNKYQQLNILDLGCNNGDAVMDRFSKYDIGFLLGIDVNETAIMRAKSKYRAPNQLFITADIEKEYSLEFIRKQCRPYGVQQFNIIYVSLVLLHMKDPQRLLKTLYELLEPSGTIFIRDIDDEMNLAYPDTNKWFNKCYDIAHYSPTAGYRHSGRQIPSFLYQCGFKDIYVPCKGLDTCACSSPEEREGLYNTYFSFLLEDLQITVKNNPHNKEYTQDFYWLQKTLPSIKNLFMQSYFYFNLGFMTILASK